MDLEAARLATIKVSGVSPNVALFGDGAKKAFIQNANVQKYLWNRRFELGTVAPMIEDDAVVLFGLATGLQLYSYSEYFEDDTGTLFPMLPDGVVLLLSTNVQNKIVYGAFTQLEQIEGKVFRTYQTARIPLVYGDLDGGALYYRLTSCPLPMPADILGIRYIEALPGSAGPFGRGGDGDPEPFFESNEPDKQPQLAEKGQAAAKKAEKDREALLKTGVAKNKRGPGVPPYEELTVPELKEMADERGIEIDSRANKSEIIDALKWDDEKGKS
jgi:hypothetical protein